MAQGLEGSSQQCRELLDKRWPEMRQQLLDWWEVHGRKDIAIKPWMFTGDGRWPEQHEDLSPYGIWIAEVMLHPPAVSAGSA